MRTAFRMSWPRTVVGAWLVLRANMVWAPYPDNDPDKARALMTRFYQLLRKSGETGFAPRRAAELEVEWWRVHREAQREGGDAELLVDALANLYAYTYGAERDGVRQAAALRAEERSLLVRSYASLLAATFRP